LAFSQPSRQLATSYIKTINDLYIKTKSNARKSHKNKNHTHTHKHTPIPKAETMEKTDEKSEERGRKNGRTTSAAGDVKREFCEFY